MAGSITWYDVLGVVPGASADTLRAAYEARLRQLPPDLAAGAVSPVVAAVSRARDSVELAWLVVGDPQMRRRYDEQIRPGRPRGLAAPGRVATGGDDGSQPYGLLLTAADLGGPPGLALAGLADWLLTPHPAPSPRRVTVPDVCGLFFRTAHAVAALAGLRLAVVRLTPDPLPVEGLVVTQDPAAGMRVRRRSAFTVRVWHPPRARR